MEEAKPNTNIDKRVYELMDAINKMKRTHFINHEKQSEKHVLWLIGEFKDRQRINVSEIAKRLDVTTAAITHHINALEKEGLVKRSISPDDHRVISITLTKKGVARIEKMKTTIAEKTGRLIEYLGDKDSQKMIILAHKITEFFKSCEAKNLPK